MIDHPSTYLEQLTPEGAEAVHQAALGLLEKIGLEVESAAACKALREAGVRVDRARRARFPWEVMRDCLLRAPRTWRLYARDRNKNVVVGGRHMLLSPGYGSPYVANAAGERREATLADIGTFAYLAAASEAIDITGGMLVEPADVPLALRPLEVTYALIANSPKPFFGSVAGADGARESLSLARLLFPNLEERPCVIGLININSPLRLDENMADALIEYARAGQPVLLTPGILTGITAPVTPAGALVQAWAELLGAAVLVQSVRPGCPTILGLGGFGADLRDVTPQFGRPENAMAAVLGAHMARGVGMPFRCSAGVTGARQVDCRSGYERMLTALSGWSAGAHICVHAAGTLDSINSMCFDQFIIDLEMWSYVKRFAAPPEVDGETLAHKVIATAGGSYLAHDHTMRHMHDSLFTPSLVPAETYEDWIARGRPDVASEAQRWMARMADEAPAQGLSDDLRGALEEHVARRREDIGLGLQVRV